jgi:Cell division protein
MRISTIGYTTKQGFKNITRNKMFSFASMATMAACIFVFGLFFALVMNLRHIVEKVEEGVAITVFFDEELPQSRMDAIGTELEGRPEVASINFVTAEEAWEKFQDDYFGEAESAVAEGFQDDNPLVGSDHYEVFVESPELQAELVDYVENLEGVRRVNKSDIVARTLTSINRLVTYVSIAIIAILLGITIFLISNTITTGITIRREEIAIMKYIGAKDGFVRAPFVIEGLIIGFIGAIIPLSALYFLYNTAIEYILERFMLLRNIIDFLPVHQVYELLLPVGLTMGIGIGFLGSAITVRKHLRV